MRWETSVLSLHCPRAGPGQGQPTFTGPWPWPSRVGPSQLARGPGPARPGATRVGPGSGQGRPGATKIPLFYRTLTALTSPPRFCLLDPFALGHNTSSHAAVASQPHCLHPPASVPLRSGASPLDFSMTRFNKVKLPASALLSDSLEAPKDTRAAWWDTLWRIPINSFADSQLQAPASLVTLVSSTLLTSAVPTPFVATLLKARRSQSYLSPPSSGLVDWYACCCFCLRPRCMVGRTHFRRSGYSPHQARPCCARQGYGHS